MYLIHTCININIHFNIEIHRYKKIWNRLDFIFKCFNAVFLVTKIDDSVPKNRPKNVLYLWTRGKMAGRLNLVYLNKYLQTFKPREQTLVFVLQIFDYMY